MKEILLPPLGLLLLGLLGTAFARLKRRWSWLDAALVFFALGYVSSLPFIVHSGLRALELSPPLPIAEVAAMSRKAEPPRAIVILSAGLQSRQNPIQQGGVDELSLERLQMGARLARATDLPIMTSGGCEAGPGQPALADHMAEALAQDFRVEARWRERRSCNTYENARFSAALLRELGIERIVLVTHAWHLRRAVWSFRQMDIDVIPVGTGYTGPYRFSLTDLLPSAQSFRTAYYVFHEWIGLVWYRLHYG